MTNPIATIELNNGKAIKLELYPAKAPVTVGNFIYLANERKLYDGLIFHRVIPDFMVQGGDPNGNGTGGPDYNIFGEFASNGFKQNDISHKKGVISMARRSFPLNSAGSQFFICVADCTFLDGDYAAFGAVTEGLENAVDISKVARDYNDMPYEPQVIKTIRVETFGKTYEKPATAK